MIAEFGIFLHPNGAGSEDEMDALMVMEDILSGWNHLKLLKYT